ncbi:MAG: D-isomer specific 2-hydroxyacid dehydrogenase family protein [Acidimicrobiales bacterium]
MAEAKATRVAIGPREDSWAMNAVRAGGGVVTAVSEDPPALVWTDFSTRTVDQLKNLLDTHPSIEWVQLPLAGIERFVESGIVDAKRTWTSAKGLYAEPVAEHALALALACLRDLPERARATSWGRPAATSLYDEKVTILGAGGISVSLIGLLQPFRAEITVVRQHPEPVEGAHRTVGVDRLHEALSSALVVVLALAVTAETKGLIGEEALRTMRGDAVLVNIARGPIVDTDALVAALEGKQIAWAALDVTDPEPLPDGHPLWGLSNCLITPHTADTVEMNAPLLSARITANVRRFGQGEALEGLVDPALGY